ncbi:hypothetical protein [Hymenobacter sp. B81]|uniref:hypothetical protein n=1 Tax=Hymenobacter sp. B81 TaxID=3344878 RepID=UPI0037DC5FBA
MLASRIYQDFRGNPYLGETVEQAYERLRPKLLGVFLRNDTARAAQVLFDQHYTLALERYQLVKQMRQDVSKLILAAPASELRYQDSIFHGHYTIREAELNDPAKQAAFREVFLLKALARFTAVSEGPATMTAGQLKYLQAKLGAPNINRIRELDNNLLPALLQQLTGYVARALAAQEQQLKGDQAQLGPAPGRPALSKAARANLNKDAQQRAADIDLITSTLLPDTRSTLLLNRSQILTLAPAIPQPAAAPSLEAAALDGLARFVAKRLKEELNAAFFERFNALLHDESYVELRTMFPNTTRLVTAGSVDYSAIVQLLRAAFEKDLRDLFFNFHGLLNHSRYQRLMLTDSTSTSREKERAQLLRYTHVLLFTLGEMQRGTHPVSIISRINQQLHTISAPAEARQVAGVVHVLAESFLQEGQLEQAWADAKQVQALINQPANQNLQLRCFLGLVHQRLLYQPVALPVLADGKRLYQLVFGFARLATDMQEQVDTLRRKVKATKQADRLQPEDFIRLYQLGLEVTSFASEQVLLRPLPQVKEVERVSQAVIDGYQAALHGRYGVTVSNVMLLVQTTVPDQLRNRSQLLKYAPFMAAMAEARNPEQMEKAIEAVALPAGSSSIKRKSFTNISLNAFPGITSGREFAYVPKAGTEDVTGSWKPNLGFTSAIGLSFARALRGNVYSTRNYRSKRAALRTAQNYHYYNNRGQEHYLKGRSLGVFVPLIDIGALVLYRLNDSLNNAPLPEKVRFRQVIAPGLFFMYHTGRSPVSLFAGAQLSPRLRQFRTDAQSAVQEANALRLNAGITIDLPLLNFYSRTERQQGNDDSGSIYTKRVEDLEKVVEALKVDSAKAAARVQQPNAKQRHLEADAQATALYNRAQEELRQAKRFLKQ